MSFLWLITSEPFALYPALTNVSSFNVISASILNWTAPPSSVPFGATNFNVASKSSPGIAAIFTIIDIPFSRLPTSASSTWPSKIIFVKSAIIATDVPSLKLLAAITWSPNFTGISKIVPDTVALIFVLAVDDPDTDPFLKISRSFLEAVRFSLAVSKLNFASS